MWKYIYSGTCLKNGRTSNMDSLLVKIRQLDGESALLAVVCDGVGSLRDGAFASGAAAKELGEWFDSLSSLERAGMKMRDMVHTINAYIVQTIKQKKLQTASTLSAILFFENRYHITHVGDSRVYANDGHTLVQLTYDDVSETGSLKSYIGQKDGLVPQYLEGEASGHTFLICSDGLYKRMDREFLFVNMRAGSTRTAKNSVNVLTRYVIDRGEKDNITTVLIKTMN